MKILCDSGIINARKDGKWTHYKINKDILKIVFFALGSLVGSYIGSLIEEKIALGSSIITSIINEKDALLIIRTLRKKRYVVSTINIDNKKRTIAIMVHRKRIKNVSNIIKKIDNNAVIIAQSINPISIW